MCIPHTGSRTNFRAFVSAATSTGACEIAAPWPIRRTKRRRSATLQESTTTQNKNRNKRTINVISSDYERGRRLTQPF